jgi:2'-5' RNA ligase
MTQGLVNMKTAHLSPATGIYQYLLIASPDKTVYDQVMEEKQFFSSRFKAPIASKTKPHITIASYMSAEGLEDTMIRCIHRTTSMQKSFEVVLDRFSSFGTHTIYLDIQDKQPFNMLVQELKAVDRLLQQFGCPQMKFVSNNSAHLTIARQLRPDIYADAIQEYADKKFAAFFEVKELVLLKRASEYDTCKTVNVFRLQPR